MTPNQDQWRWLDTRETVTLTELSHCCGISEAELDELVEYRALVPVAPAAQVRAFSAEWVAPLRSACKLRADFDLDLFTVAILLDNLARIETLEKQVQSLQALLPPQMRSDMGFRS
jgi:chaperone modulatory protein CbpM